MPPPASRSPGPTGSAVEALWTRAARVELPLPGVDAAVESWLDSGGVLAVTGPSGSGRSRLIAQLRARLQAEGRAVLTVVPGPHAGAPLARALVDPDLPGTPAALPSYRSAERRALAAARMLLQRAGGELWVLVDDADQLDPVTTRGLQAIGSAGLCPTAEPSRGGVLLVGPKAPGWSQQTISLPQLAAPSVRQMLQRLLGTPAPPTALLDAVLKASHGIVGNALTFLVDCLHEGILISGPAGWRLREGPAARASDGWTSHLRLLGLPVAAIRLGALVAASPGGLTRDALDDMLPLGASAQLDALTAPLCTRGLLVREGERLRCPGSAARGLLLDAIRVPLPASLRRHIRRPERLHLPGQRPDPEDARLPFDLEALVREDPVDAARIGRSLLVARPSPTFARITSEAMAWAGESRSLIGVLQRLVAGALSESCELWSRLARLQLEVLDDRSTAREALRQADRLHDASAPRPLILEAAEAALHIAEGQAGDALRVIDRALGPEGPLPEPHEQQLTIDLHLLRARALAQSENLDAALACLDDPPPGMLEEDREAYMLVGARLLVEARRHLEASERFAGAAAVDPLGQCKLQIHWLEQAATSAYRGGDPSAAVAHWRAAASLAKELGETGLYSPLLISCARVLGELCRFAEARHLAETVHGHAASTERGGLAATAAMVLGDLATAQREFETATDWYDRAEGALAGPTESRQRARLRRRRAELAVLCDQPHAENTVEQAISACDAARLPRDRARSAALLAICHARLGRIDRIGPTLEDAMAPLREQGESAVLAEVRVHAAFAWLIAGELDAAEAAATRAQVWAEERGQLALRARAEDLGDRVRSHRVSPTAAGPGEALDRLLEVSMALASERDLDVLLGRINRAALDLIAGDRAFVLLLDAAGSPQVRAAADAFGDDPGTPSSSIVRAALDRGREIIVSDIDERSEYRDTVSLVQISVRSAMCMPMTEGGRVLGLLYVDSRHVGRRELLEATRLLRGLAGHAAIAVANARLLAESADRARRAAEVAHDLRSPAASILMAAREVSEEQGIPDWISETAGLIADQADKLVGMAERFLAGRPTEAKLVDLVELTRRLVRLHAPAARARDRSIVLGTLDPATVMGDAQELDRALTNLVSNAVRHTPAGTAVRITIRAQGSTIDWSIRDRGTGIEDGLLARIFDQGVTGEGGEHGLGLGICRRIVEQHGGRVWAENHRSGGARFVVRLPPAEEDPAFSLS
jgi:signal transduction histidine kinase